MYKANFRDLNSIAYFKLTRRFYMFNDLTHDLRLLSFQVELENRTGSSLSNCKDPADLDRWDKDAVSNAGSGSVNLHSGNGSANGRQLPPIVSSPNNAPTPPSYHLTTSSPSYLYPEGFSRMQHKVNLFSVSRTCFNPKTC